MHGDTSVKGQTREHSGPYNELLRYLGSLKVGHGTESERQRLSLFSGRGEPPRSSNSKHRYMKAGQCGILTYIDVNDVVVSFARPAVSPELALTLQCESSLLQFGNGLYPMGLINCYVNTGCMLYRAGGRGDRDAVSSRGTVATPVLTTSSPAAELENHGSDQCCGTCASTHAL